jgi:cysteine synthase A
MSTRISGSLLDSIGNTPLVHLGQMSPVGGAAIYLKLEYMNPTGSKKDRMALAMIEGAEERGQLTPGMSVVEHSGGSTGTALALICSVKGYRFRLVT